MIRVYVNMNESEIEDHGATRSTICPYCFADVYYDEVSPVYCTKCKEVLEPYSDIEQDVDRRIEYYRSKPYIMRKVICFG